MRRISVASSLEVLGSESVELDQLGGNGEIDGLLANLDDDTTEDGRVDLCT